MTMMDSDSASQDSDEGRRFRFEATRKDAFAPKKETTNERETSRNFRSKLSHESDRHYRDRRERSKHESDKRTNDKDFRQSSSKYSRHSRQEYNKNSYKDHLSSRDTSVGSTQTDRDSRNSCGGDTRERSRNSKRHSDKDRSAYSARHSKERSYDRNYHDGRTSSDKHRNRDYERYKHRSRDRSQNRVHQSNKVKSSSDDYRDGHGKRDSFQKRTSSKENKLQNSKEHLSPSSKNVKEAYNKNTKNDTVDSHECKDLDLSQFDVLSEIDENMSDSRDSESRTSSSPHLRKRERHESNDRAESCVIKKRTKEIGDGASERERPEESCKVKQRKYDQVSTSSNNPSAISDSSRAFAPSATLSITREFLADFEREKSEQAEKKMISHDDVNERLNSSDETKLLGRCIGQTRSTYGPLLPPGLVSSDNKLETNTLSENKINDNVNSNSTSFIGPCLPSLSNNCQNKEREDAVTSNMSESDAVFGPALPPHLLQRQRDKSRDKFIGPILSNVEKLQKESLVASWESDDDSAIGPLPADHPALRNSQVHEQLDLRAETIRRKGYQEAEVINKREEWMTELPPAQHPANLVLARKFRTRDGPDMSDRSSWTDTPTQKAQKKNDSEYKKLSNIQNVDEKHVDESHKHKSDESEKRGKSLLEIHQSTMREKKRKKEKAAKQLGISTRRPFDRDIDLQANRLNQTQKRSILMKAQSMDDKFVRGKI
ncbi:uncharacterized protein DDB_G0287625 [Pseudomyrmex gracilis]|uniref:uncharacterized protein DDB_G0287625 n=1 Tax=Pseudomyrmex gracilis TaxID=219809 RepID=UPI000995CDD5|nr:uncharacterized protein DDB_G0287625 [Pseudomyrmex gracilis]XP_020289752.1 uncharacterized protein DDB_G0287625 [Pseudomyrmex gracilis]XP_020289759.1 uncharacterized protein DDB_G0287625 [Pseudomyrmex gracilis]XP_020289768.1 uncharacterized protein DDB_G0287625 [Pseudomyrmex gracilis]XP_020289777.1 uncharacterized protein DDB_G0287625 [Pseudomyrmex gracilis]